MRNNKIFKICLTGLFAAIIAVFTAFVKIPTGINSGYLHFGDSVVYLSGCVLGPFGLISSAIGGALADILAGAAVWALPTAIIKALNCVPFIVAMKMYRNKKGESRTVNVYTLVATVISAAITIGGYYIAEGFMYSFPSALASVPFSVVQSIGSAIIFALMGKALDSTKVGKFLR